MNRKLDANWSLVDPRAYALRRAVGARPVVGITGSCAKTSTKHLLTRALAGSLRVAGNSKSFNVIDGIRSTLGRVKPDTDVVVQELGATGLGSLDRLLLALLPTIGVVTAIGDDHLTAFRSREAVLREKFKLVSSLPSEGTAILNLDDPLLAEMVSRVHCRLLTYGRSPSADFHASEVTGAWPDRLRFRLHHAGREFDVRTRLLGVVSLTAALASIATAHALGVELDGFIDRLARVDPVPQRMQPVEERNGVAFIRDDYKAAGYMLDAVAAYLGEANAGRRVLVLGNVSDVKKTGRIYRRVARRCRELGVDLIAVGEIARKSLRRSEFGWEEGVGVFESVIEVIEYVEENLEAGDVVLLKASGAAHLDRIVLSQKRAVRCRATMCGANRRCESCPELETARDAGFRVGGSR